MSRIRRARPSPALLVAAIALVAALGGSAVADQATSAKKDKLTKQERKKVKKLADKRIAKAEPNLDVNSAKSADTATTADTAASATNADRVDGADVCNGTIVISGDGTQTLCSSGPISVVGSCDVGATSTTVSVSVATSEDAAWYQGGEDLGIEPPGPSSDEAPFGDVYFPAAESPREVANEADSNADADEADAVSVEISMGHDGTAGASLAGRFGTQANHLGTNQGECRFASGAIAG